MPLTRKIEYLRSREKFTFPNSTTIYEKLGAVHMKNTFAILECGTSITIEIPRGTQVIREKSSER